MFWTLTARLSAIFLASASESDCLKIYNSQINEGGNNTFYIFYWKFVNKQPVNLRSENCFIIISILLSDAAHAFHGHDLA